MKVIVPIDSLKGIISSFEAGNAAKEGIQRAKPAAEVIIKPLADGGEGTVDAIFPIERGVTIMEEAVKKENAYPKYVCSCRAGIPVAIGSGNVYIKGVRYLGTVVLTVFFMCAWRMYVLMGKSRKSAR